MKYVILKIAEGKFQECMFMASGVDVSVNNMSFDLFATKEGTCIVFEPGTVIKLKGWLDSPSLNNLEITMHDVESGTLSSQVDVNLIKWSVLGKSAKVCHISAVCNILTNTLYTPTQLRDIYSAAGGCFKRMYIAMEEDSQDYTRNCAILKQAIEGWQNKVPVQELLSVNQNGAIFREGTLRYDDTRAMAGAHLWISPKRSNIVFIEEPVFKALVDVVGMHIDTYKRIAAHLEKYTC